MGQDHGETLSVGISTAGFKQDSVYCVQGELSSVQRAVCSVYINKTKKTKLCLVYQAEKQAIYKP